MQDIYTVSGKVTNFSPQWVKIFPDVNAVKMLVQSETIGMLIKPNEGLAINLTFTPTSAVKLAKSLRQASLTLGMNTRVVAQYTHSNGYYFYRLKSVDGVAVPAYSESEPTSEAPKPPINSQASPSVSSEAKSSISSSSASQSSSSSDNGIEAGLASLRAMFPDSSSSSSSNSSQSSVASSTISSSAKSSSIAVSSVSSSSASSSFPSFSVSSVSSSVSVNSAFSPVSSSVPSSASKSNFEDENSFSVMTDVFGSSSASSSVSNSDDSALQSNADTYYKEDDAHSASLVSKKLDKFSKYRSLMKKDDTFGTTKDIYNSLLNKPRTQIHGGVRKAYDSENWRDFTKNLWYHARVDFNLTLNQRVTDARMNYATGCNFIPGLEQKEKPKPKPKKEHLTDKNVF